MRLVSASPNVSGMRSASSCAASASARASSRFRSSTDFLLVAMTRLLDICAPELAHVEELLQEPIELALVADPLAPKPVSANSHRHLVLAQLDIELHARHHVGALEDFPGVAAHAARSP